ncbi:MAG: nucleoside diphosphate kinase regulator [Anaeromyxobacter sp.]
MAGPIYIVETELERLKSLVDQHLDGRDGAAAERLGAELDRALVRDPAELPPDVVTLDSSVSYVDERTGVVREVTVVFPAAADANTRRISVLAPVGAALLGLRQGDGIEWPLPDGRVAQLRILRVVQPAAAAAPGQAERAAAS